MTNRVLPFASLMLLLAACGGNVVVDGTGGGATSIGAARAASPDLATRLRRRI
jgi:hypothetical protein